MKSLVVKAAAMCIGTVLLAHASALPPTAANPGILLLPRRPPPAAARQVKGDDDDDDDDCTERSLALRTLRVFGAALTRWQRAPGSGEATDLRFRLGNALAGDSEPCASPGTGAGAVVSPSEWVNCVHNTRDPTAPRSSYRYDAAANELTVQGTWICGGGGDSTGSPLAMDAYGVGSIPFVCQELADADGAQQCTQEHDVEIEVTVSSRPAENR
ncbi:hypothetical protein GGTG_08639 [Gaeumannomyces tritici R3-111a-1]|uniref:AA1-like domain-containing protein n=1 Tax=Gaeumannomyces tritici (strain R3-111a-1) TaxID=644352 RepID=J3P553_GAET3|nr:hypothetical protein GGTG_08639 [Gaeumannomyces tritici R3-111a-1]EJT74801.1 hypothetical protein GGTG_08639 [Gaeumannomyces tritici R3-111a-1]